MCIGPTKEVFRLFTSCELTKLFVIWIMICGLIQKEVSGHKLD